MNCSDCCVDKCTSKIGDCDILFHKFPEKGQRNVQLKTKSGILVIIDRREAWKKILHVNEFDARRSRVCSLHFKPTDYLYISKAAIIYHPEKKIAPNRLRRFAVPSLRIPGFVPPPPIILNRIRNILQQSEVSTPRKPAVNPASDPPVILNGQRNFTKPNVIYIKERCSPVEFLKEEDEQVVSVKEERDPIEDQQTLIVKEERDTLEDWHWPMIFVKEENDTIEDEQVVSVKEESDPIEDQQTVIVKEEKGTLEDWDWPMKEENCTIEEQQVKSENSDVDEAESVKEENNSDDEADQADPAKINLVDIKQLIRGSEHQNFIKSDCVSVPTVRNTVYDESEPSLLKCEFCIFTTSLKTVLSRHIQVKHSYARHRDKINFVRRRDEIFHTSEKPFKCPKCDHQFLRWDSLRNHIAEDYRRCRFGEPIRHIRIISIKDSESHCVNPMTFLNS